jgi:membrane-bound lytic murein transglycosylase D
LLLLIGTITSNTVSAFADTTRKKVFLAANKAAKKLIVLKEANVEYPEKLKEEKEESLSYVEKFSTAKRGYLQRTYLKSKKYFPRVISILKKYDVPSEFAVLLALESGFNGNAVSSAGAVGYWQIMDDVAREYGLKVASKNAIAPKNLKNKKSKKIKPQVDDRKNFLKSTYAAARYLRDRSRNLNGDILLIAASYNYGVGNVWNAMQRTGKSNPDFWDIKNYLPAETRAYVMNFIALNVIFRNYQKFASNDLSFRTITKEAELFNAEKLDGGLLID